MKADAFNPRYAWYVTALLALMYVFSFVDRLVIGLLAVDIGRDLQLSDTHLGLLIGTSFAIVYSIAGLPLANLLDRRNRKNLLIMGVSLWSLCTIAAGFAENFELLAITRIGVAVGEAVITPAAVSLIADLFPRDKRIAPMVAYGAVASLMIVGGLAIGAAALQLAQVIGPQFGVTPWRLVFVLVGLPPLLIAAIFAATTTEPRRGCFDEEQDEDQPAAGLRASVDYLVTHRGFYGSFYLAAALISVFVYGFMTWTPALLIRGYGWEPAAAGYAFGATGITFGLLGLLAWPRLTILLERRGVAHPMVLVIAIGCALCLPAALLLLLAQSNGPLFIGLSLSIFAATATSCLSPLAMQHYSPPAMRARFTALLLLAQSLIGYGLGPPVIAEIAKHWDGEGRALGLALASVALAIIPPAALCYWLARRSLYCRAKPQS